MKKKLTISAVALILSMGGIGATSMTAANAEEIPNSIKSLETESSTVEIGSFFKLSGTWAVPDNSQAGDTFRMELPEELRAAAASTNFDLKNANGDVIATAEVVEENGTQVVVFTLTDFVTENPLNVRGSFEMALRVVSTVEPGTEIVITVGGTALKVTAQSNDYVPGYVTHTKYAWGENGYTIEVGGESLNTIVTDTSRLSTPICDTIEVKIGNQSYGYPTSWTTLEGTSLVSCDENGFILDVGDIPQDMLARITYRSDFLEFDPETGERVEKVENEYTVSSSVYESGGSASRTVFTAGGDGDGENGGSDGSEEEDDETEDNTGNGEDNTGEGTEEETTTEEETEEGTEEETTTEEETEEGTEEETTTEEEPESVEEEDDVTVVDNKLDDQTSSNDDTANDDSTEKTNINGTSSNGDDASNGSTASESNSAANAYYQVETGAEAQEMAKKGVIAGTIIFIGTLLTPFGLRRSKK